ncbi:DUF2946 family protein [Deinococcus arenicola]|uniref:DUF2946 domain-containing protein n=1 Tax=Deinococcus arenicola TaxID=2994950 RepID=A0ABU4DNI4_9DEIO|nr:DUF2946 family protein [Deinococcus sp. ZS9-10]MDV6373998.1 hypothetical protein [Deinococcus sp. ZS9-10]
MKPARSVHRVLSRLMAVLTVIAAFAFQARVGGMTDMDMGGPAPVSMSGMAGHDMAGMGNPSPSSAHRTVPPQAPPQGGQRESHNHAAYCPFCVTGAFALEAGVLPFSTAPPYLALQPLPFAQAHLPALPRHADARAPPALL